MDTELTDTKTCRWMRLIKSVPDIEDIKIINMDPFIFMKVRCYRQMQLCSERKKLSGLLSSLTCC